MGQKTGKLPKYTPLGLGGPKAPSSRSERARPAGAEKMRARSARFFSYLKLGRFVCLSGVQQKMNKIRLDQLSKVSEGIMGDGPRQVRGPWGVVLGK